MPVVLLIDDGFHVPEMPLGEVAFKAGAVAPEHKVKVGAKFGVAADATATVTTSEIVEPQLAVAVKVS